MKKSAGILRPFSYMDIHFIAYGMTEIGMKKGLFNFLDRSLKIESQGY